MAPSAPDRWLSLGRTGGSAAPEYSVCDAHLLRELTGIEENNPEHKRAVDFKNLPFTMKSAKEKAIRKGRTALSCYRLHKFDKEYKRIMELADQECPPPMAPLEKKGKETISD